MDKNKKRVLFRGVWLCAIVAGAVAPLTPRPRPRFEDFPATPSSLVHHAPLKLNLRAERMFKTRLTEAAAKAPNFAGNLRSVGWGCGSNCGAGAVIDLETGTVYQPPLAAGKKGWERWALTCGMFDGAGWWGRIDSRLLIVRCGKTWVERINSIVPDTYYFVWEGNRFRQLLKIPADQADLPKDAMPLD